MRGGIWASVVLSTGVAVLLACPAVAASKSRPQISAETVKRHLASIYAKLAIPGRVALAIHVVRSRAA